MERTYLAMGDDDWTLPRLEILQSKAENPPKPLGRASLLSDAQLTNRRDQLVQLLEGAWGKIGHGLRWARTPQGVRKVLAQVEFGGYQNLLAPFVLASDASPDAAQMRTLRRQIGKLNEATYKLSEKQRETTEALRQAEMAVNQGSKANLKALKNERTRRKRQAKRTHDRYTKREQEARALRAELESIEAAYAQRELLSLVKTKRYSYTPLHLADGMAGLPYMGWRQSAARCYREDMKRMKLLPEEQRNERCQFANGLWYTIFLMIQKAVEPQKSATKITSELARSVASMNERRKQYIKGFIIENWYFLKRAIRSEHKADPYSKSLPFRIVAAFQKQFQAQSPEDQVLREMGKLNIANP